MKIRAWVPALLIGLAFQASAQSKDTLYTAHVAADGTLLRQSPKWITTVQRQSQPDYLSEYTLTFDPRLLKQAPRFCVASPVDTSSTEAVLHGQAKLSGAPKATHVAVTTQLVDTGGPSGNNDLEFMVMCTR